MNLLKTLSKHLILFLIGGTTYYLIETIFKQIVHGCGSHWTMFVLGGICFVAIGLINELFTYDMSLIKQCIIGCILVTILELITGIIVNLQFGLNVWNYSDMPYNFMGQICLTFSLIWLGLSLVCIVVDDYLRYWLFKEEKPHYRW